MPERLETNLWRLHAGTSSLLNGIDKMGHKRKALFSPPVTSHMGLRTSGSRKILYEPEVQSTKPHVTEDDVKSLVLDAAENKYPNPNDYRRTVVELTLQGKDLGEIAETVGRSVYTIGKVLRGVRPIVDKQAILKLNLVRLSPLATPDFPIDRLAHATKTGTISGAKILARLYGDIQDVKDYKNYSPKKNPSKPTLQP